MICPRCMKTDVSSVNNTHYVCNNPTCVDDIGKRTQFLVIPDKVIQFPYNVIYPERQRQEFYKKPYLNE